MTFQIATLSNNCNTATTASRSSGPLTSSTKMMKNVTPGIDLSSSKNQLKQGYFDELPKLIGVNRFTALSDVRTPKTTVVKDGTHVFPTVNLLSKPAEGFTKVVKPSKRSVDFDAKKVTFTTSTGPAAYCLDCINGACSNQHAPEMKAPAQCYAWLISLNKPSDCACGEGLTKPDAHDELFRGVFKFTVNEWRGSDFTRFPVIMEDGSICTLTQCYRCISGRCNGEHMKNILPVDEQCSLWTHVSWFAEGACPCNNQAANPKMHNEMYKSVLNCDFIKAFDGLRDLTDMEMTSRCPHAADHTKKVNDERIKLAASLSDVIRRSRAYGAITKEQCADLIKEFNTLAKENVHEIYEKSAKVLEKKIADLKASTDLVERATIASAMLACRGSRPDNNKIHAARYKLRKELVAFICNKDAALVELDAALTTLGTFHEYKMINKAATKNAFQLAAIQMQKTRTPANIMSMANAIYDLSVVPVVENDDGFEFELTQEQQAIELHNSNKKKALTDSFVALFKSRISYTEVSTQIQRLLTHGADMTVCYEEKFDNLQRALDQYNTSQTTSAVTELETAIRSLSEFYDRSRKAIDTSRIDLVTNYAPMHCPTKATCRKEFAHEDTKVKRGDVMQRSMAMITKRDEEVSADVKNIVERFRILIPMWIEKQRDLISYLASVHALDNHMKPDGSIYDIFSFYTRVVTICLSVLMTVNGCMNINDSSVITLTKENAGYFSEFRLIPDADEAVLRDFVKRRTWCSKIEWIASTVDRSTVVQGYDVCKAEVVYKPKVTCPASPECRFGVHSESRFINLDLFAGKIDYKLESWTPHVKDNKVVFSFADYMTNCNVKATAVKPKAVKVKDVKTEEFPILPTDKTIAVKVVPVKPVNVIVKAIQPVVTQVAPAKPVIDIGKALEVFHAALAATDKKLPTDATPELLRAGFKAYMGKNGPKEAQPLIAKLIDNGFAIPFFGMSNTKLRNNCGRNTRTILRIANSEGVEKKKALEQAARDALKSLSDLETVSHALTINSKARGMWESMRGNMPSMASFLHKVWHMLAKSKVMNFYYNGDVKSYWDMIPIVIKRMADNKIGPSDMVRMFTDSNTPAEELNGLDKQIEISSKFPILHIAYMEYLGTLSNDKVVGFHSWLGVEAQRYIGGKTISEMAEVVASWELKQCERETADKLKSRQNRYFKATGTMEGFDSTAAEEEARAEASVCMHSHDWLEADIQERILTWKRDLQDVCTLSFFMRFSSIVSKAVELHGLDAIKAENLRSFTSAEAAEWIRHIGSKNAIPMATLKLYNAALGPRVEGEKRMWPKAYIYRNKPEHVAELKELAPEVINSLAIAIASEPSAPTAVYTSDVIAKLAELYASGTETFRALAPELVTKHNDKHVVLRENFNMVISLYLDSVAKVDDIIAKHVLLDRFNASGELNVPDFVSSHTGDVTMKTFGSTVFDNIRAGFMPEYNDKDYWNRMVSIIKCYIKKYKGVFNIDSDFVEALDRLDSHLTDLHEIKVVAPKAEGKRITNKQIKLDKKAESEARDKMQRKYYDFTTLEASLTEKEKKEMEARLNSSPARLRTTAKLTFLEGLIKRRAMDAKLSVTGKKGSKKAQIKLSASTVVLTRATIDSDSDSDSSDSDSD